MHLKSLQCWLKCETGRVDHDDSYLVMTMSLRSKNSLVRCGGKSHCYVRANNNLLLPSEPDNCPETPKYLEAHFVCAEGTLSSMPP